MHPTVETIRECLDYNPETGLFTHRARPQHYFDSVRDMKKWNTRYAGKLSGRIRRHKNGKRYAYVTLMDQEILAHRVAWAWMTGDHSKRHVDHIDGCGTNNTWCNLREVSPDENSRNMRLFATSKTGIPGVNAHTQVQGWNVRIQSKGVVRNLGFFKDFFEACCARKSAELSLDFHPSHGRERPL